jgi:hypothetical protein
MNKNPKQTKRSAKLAAALKRNVARRKRKSEAGSRKSESAAARQETGTRV